ncbi:hypothetical protein [Haliangium ochraceum]|uniref:Uncharacterized protein n=1 Tax=Haliangium ochraceum (strain DSM 14365 / JCM 11303 / SMP-2) TaxID=502025 RepID=D0LPF9_HALO1|nr:hypothetical protein [Haliangium ochraceum]ACY13524.1 hypothetical protein Hoch_0916 [Haliangium ochraceum DSM 14365]
MPIQAILSEHIEQECYPCGALHEVPLTAFAAGVKRGPQVNGQLMQLPACAGCGAVEFLVASSENDAGGHNRPSVGIEVVNPYYPRNLRDALPWKRVIDAPWAHEKRYVVPTLEQAEATSKLVRVLTGSIAGLSIPRTWRGIRSGKLVMSRLRDGEQRIPGIY